MSAATQPAPAASGSPAAELLWRLSVEQYHAMIDAGIASLDSLRTVPASGYAMNTPGREVSNEATAQWYEYSWTSHVLSPKPNVFALRTADGRYAAFEILSYYCPTAQAGCTTIRYRYQGAGGTVFDPDGFDPGG